MCKYTAKLTFLWYVSFGKKERSLHRNGMVAIPKTNNFKLFCPCPIVVNLLSYKFVKEKVTMKRTVIDTDCRVNHMGAYKTGDV